MDVCLAGNFRILISLNWISQQECRTMNLNSIKTWKFSNKIMNKLQNYFDQEIASHSANDLLLTIRRVTKYYSGQDSFWTLFIVSFDNFCFSSFSWLAFNLAISLDKQSINRLFWMESENLNEINVESQQCEIRVSFYNSSELKIDYIL